EALVSAAFGVQSVPQSADEVASYVISGRFNTDIGTFVEREPVTIERILKFRRTQDGERLRREVEGTLNTDETRFFAAAVNGAMKRIIPPSVLQSVRDGLSTLFMERAHVTQTPAVWGNQRQPDAITRLWRQRSREELLRLCKEKRIGKGDPCI